MQQTREIQAKTMLRLDFLRGEPTTDGTTCPNCPDINIMPGNGLILNKLHCQHLTKDIKKKWTPEEDELVMQLYDDIGPNWSGIASALANRSVKQVKNRFYKHLLKQIAPNSRWQCVPCDQDRGSPIFPAKKRIAREFSNDQEQLLSMTAASTPSVKEATLAFFGEVDDEDNNCAGDQ